MARLRSEHRRNEIARLAASHGLTSVEELSARLGVTASTIRRDLALLTAQGKLARTYGGALSLEPHPEASLRQRLGEAHEAKQAIAALGRRAGRPRRERRPRRRLDQRRAGRGAQGLPRACRSRPSASPRSRPSPTPRTSR